MQGADEEVRRAAGARVDAVAAAGRVRLREEVDLHGRVDAHHLREGRDDRRVVRHLAAAQPDARVVVGPVVELLGAEHEGADERLVRVEGPGAVEEHGAVADQLAPEAQPPPGVQAAEHGVGHRADAGLDARAVLDAGGDELAEPQRGLVGDRLGDRDHRVVDLDAVIDVVHAQDAVAVDERHLRVHLRDDDAAAGAHGFDGAGHDLHLDAHGDPAAARGRRVQDDHVGRAGGAEQPRRQGQPHREVAGSARGAHGRAEEDRLVRDALVRGDAGRGVDAEQGPAVEPGVEEGEQLQRGREAARGDEARFVGKAIGHGAEALGADHSHAAQGTDGPPRRPAPTAPADWSVRRPARRRVSLAGAGRPGRARRRGPARSEDPDATRGGRW